MTGAMGWLPGLSPAALDRLKLMGAGLMVLDHIDSAILLRGAYFPPLLQGYMGEADLSTLHLLLYMLGRAVFPIFAIVLAAHLACGRIRLPSMLRLIGIGLAVQPLFWWARRAVRDVGGVDPSFFHMAIPLNVFVSLGVAGLIGLALLRAPRWQAHICAGIGCTAGLMLPHSFNVIEYLFPGVLLPALLARATKPGDASFAIWAALALLGCNFSAESLAKPSLALSAITIGLFAAFIIYACVMLARNWPGDQRFMGRWSFYIFYPVHYLVLTALALTLFR